MLNMMKVGRKISELRRQQNMTQMELAEKLCISYQAVSNWERGNSMPDISKLPELAQLFGVTIDDLLGETSELISHAAQNRVEEYLEDHEVTAEELAEAAPILKPTQVDAVFPKTKCTNMGSVIKLLPFLDQQTVDELARKAADSDDIRKFVPFVSQDVLNELVAQRTESGKSIEAFLPFLDTEEIGKMAERSYQKAGLGEIVKLFPFMSRQQLEHIAKMEFEKKRMENIAKIAPFLRSDFLAKLASQLIAQGEMDSILPIAPFLDQEPLKQYIKVQFT